MKYIFSCLIVFFAIVVTQAQLAPEKAAWNNLSKERWQKVRFYLNKALKKDTSNVAANFTYSWYFFTQGNPQLHIDSAQAFLQKVKRNYPLTTKAEKQRLEWFPVNQKEIDRLQHYLDSAAFDRALQANTEQAYAYFVRQHPWAQQVPRAKELQIEVGFLMALRRNTYDAFQEFLTNYPFSYREQEAKDRYNKLLFETLTRDQTLASYQHFFDTYPESPFHAEAERSVFVLSTLLGDSLSFAKYVNQWPKGRFNTLANSILQHLNADEESAQVTLAMWGKQNYYLLDVSGKEWNISDTNSLTGNKNCEGNTSFFFLAGDKVYTNTGVYLTNQCKEIHQQPAAFCVVEKDNVFEVWHVSGQKIFETAGLIQLIGNKWWLEKNKGQYTLYSLLGKKICHGNWRKVVSFTGWLAFQNENSWLIVPERELLENEDWLKHGLVADEMRQYKQGLWYRAGDEEGLLSANGRSIIIKQKAKIEIVSGGLIVKRDSSITLIGNTGCQEQNITDAKWIKPFWIIKNKADFTLLNWQDNRLLFRLTGLDSVYCVGQQAVALKKDSLLFIAETTLFSLPKKYLLHVMRRGDSLFVVANKNQKQTIYSTKGKELFVLQDETPDYLGGNFFILTKKQKRWIVNRNGQFLFALTPDMQVTVRNNTLVILQKNKFGLAGQIPGQFIKPQFDASVQELSTTTLLGEQAGKKYLIHWNSKTLPSVFWEEIVPISERYAWAKKGFYWHLIDLNTSKTLANNITGFALLRKGPEHDWYSFKQAGYLGLLHSKQGVLLESLFTDLKIIGNENGFIVGQKEVEEAELLLYFVYDLSGKLLKKEVYQEKDWNNVPCH